MRRSTKKTFDPVSVCRGGVTIVAEWLLNGTDGQYKDYDPNDYRCLSLSIYLRGEKTKKFDCLPTRISLCVSVPELIEGMVSLASALMTMNIGDYAKVPEFIRHIDDEHVSTLGDI